MILALAGQFKQLFHEPENVSGDLAGFEPTTSRMPVQCSKMPVQLLKLSSKCEDPGPVRLIGAIGLDDDDEVRGSYCNEYRSLL